MEIEGQINKRSRDNFNHRPTAANNSNLDLDRDNATTGNEVKKKKRLNRRASATVIANGILQELLRPPDLDIPNGDDNNNGSANIRQQKNSCTSANENENGCHVNIRNASSGIEGQRIEGYSRPETSNNTSLAGYYGIRHPLSHPSSSIRQPIPASSKKNSATPTVRSKTHLNRNAIKSIWAGRSPLPGLDISVKRQHAYAQYSGPHVESNKQIEGSGTTIQKNCVGAMNGLYSKKNEASNHKFSPLADKNRMEGRCNLPCKMPQNNVERKSNDIFESINVSDAVGDNNKGGNTNNWKESPFRSNLSAKQRNTLEINGQLRGRHLVRKGNLVVDEKKTQDIVNRNRSSIDGVNHTSQPTKYNVAGRERLMNVPNSTSMNITMNGNSSESQTQSTQKDDENKKKEIEIICIDDSGSDDEDDITTKKVSQNGNKTNSNSFKRENLNVLEHPTENRKNDKMRPNPFRRQGQNTKIARDTKVNEKKMERRSTVLEGPDRSQVRTMTRIEKERIMGANPFEQADLRMRRVRRVHVNEPNVKEYITECRRNGTPLVIIGHKGWVNFARPWLKGLRRDGGSNSTTNTSLENIDIDLKDPMYRYEIDVDKMIDHIGMEDVPILRKNYNERNPISHQAKAAFFLKKHFRKDSDECVSDFYYLHQWQFPLSESAGPKLCAQCKPMPNDIFGEDILKYYLGEETPHCQWDNPFQYIFMGKGGTKSKLHQDPGGLEITIAVITGEKECILVHRDDGVDCFYDLDASLDNVDLDEYPLMTQARIWKTTIKPGDILLMPQGTYHQCRNTTACLSYSRFILDTVNLLPFYKSFQNGDAKEIPHVEILWNCAIELVKKIDNYTAEYQKCLREQAVTPSLTDDITRGVETLQSLRYFFRDIAKKDSDTAYVKIVGDIDDTLHTFEYRSILKIPRHRIM